MMKPDWIPFGFLPLFKPVGPTSHDMVAGVRKLLPAGVKVGHTGTLDPFASGVLILALGKATRFAEEIHQLPKKYRARLGLGVETNTLDPTGEVTNEMPVPSFTMPRLEALVERFTGKQLQVPPAFSAKRVRGRKSYQLARKNQSVDLPPSEIYIYHLHLSAVDDRTLACQVTCSTGAYMRALGRDLARELGTCGHLLQLERSAVGPVLSEHCLQSDDLSVESVQQHTRSVSELLPQFPEIYLPEKAFSHLLHGRPFHTHQTLPRSFLGVFEQQGSVKAIFRCNYDSILAQITPKQRCYLRPN